ncbi:hypothetical protein H0N99_01915 [Candidatus Micrarchaeota archaeon]|nr:hypothetical protein [Candidatus Micrarchaeota archaeon]
MKVQAMFLILLVGAILLVGCAQQPPGGNQTQNQTPPPSQTPTKEEVCLSSGGTIATQSCCLSAGDFPNTCLIGACGCSSDNSHNVKACNCGEGKCWDSSKSQCVAVQAQPASVDMSQIYKYGSVHSYEYNVTTPSAEQTTSFDFKSTLTSDTVNGTAAWLEQTDITMQGGSVTLKTWIDKVTYNCLKMSSVINYEGQTIEQPGTCPTTGPNSASRTGTATPTMTFVGTESVTVPAGTFSCNKYSLENVTFWSASSVPVPVKIAYGDGSMTMELVGYT